MSKCTSASSGVDAVLFDLGNTLVHYYTRAEFGPILRRSVRRIVERLQDARWPEALDEDALERRAHALNHENADGRVRPLEERLVELLGARAVPDALLAELTERFLEPIFATARLDPDALPTLAKLKAAGVKTAIVSNTPWGSSARRWRAELARLGLLEHIDAAVFCMDVGWRKPAPAVFERALEVLGVTPARACFVGDDPEWDVAGARRAGLVPVLLGDPSDAPPACQTIAKLADVIEIVERVRR